MRCAKCSCWEFCPCQWWNYHWCEISCQYFSRVNAYRNGQEESKTRISLEILVKNWDYVYFSYYNILLYDWKRIHTWGVPSRSSWRYQGAWISTRRRIEVEKMTPYPLEICGILYWQIEHEKILLIILLPTDNIFSIDSQIREYGVRRSSEKDMKRILNIFSMMPWNISKKHFRVRSFPMLEIAKIRTCCIHWFEWKVAISVYHTINLMTLRERLSIFVSGGENSVLRWERRK